MAKSKNKVEKNEAAASQIKTATLKAAKNLSRAQAERAATAASRNVNAYGQKEEGPSRWQERKEAKRQMYLMSTEKAVKLGVRKDLKSSGDRNVTSQQCQKCLQIGHWTYDCKNERTYVSRPSRSQLLKDLKLPPRLYLEESSSLQLVSREEIPETLKDDNKKRKGPMDSDSDSDESGSPPDSDTPESEESSSSTASLSGTFSSDTFSTPSRTSNSEDGESDSGHPKSKRKEEYKGMTTEDACEKRQRKLRNAARKMELKSKNKRRRGNKKR
ncbi:hypothetical protein R1sor_021091 [Riccia sorocarpa]|uniref:Zinc finger CCHC domain-containing protein 10 n=1 Tax=Riccia sorocarpa TaxID=122646 RepID=A0ABD3GG24_9MARC